MTTVPGARIVGTLRHTEHGKGAVRMEELYDTGIHDLWSALTEPSRLARWVADVEGDLRLAWRFRARFTSEWDGPGRVDVCRAPHHLAVVMAPGTAEETVIEATLTAEQDKTRPVVEERGIPLARWPSTAPAGRPTSRTSPRTCRAGRPPTGRLAGQR